MPPMRPQAMARSQCRCQCSPTVISRHNSLDAAGRVLGSMIRGNRQGEAQRIAGQGNGYKIGAVDKSTGAFIPRNAARTSGGQPVASNAHAAATLASGPKSVPVDTHPAMSPNYPRPFEPFK